MKKIRIQWNKKEWELIARRLANYLIDNPGTTLIAAYKDIADDVLPSDRQRIINNTNLFDPIIDRIKELMKAKKEAPIQSPEIVEKVVVIPPNIHDFTVEQMQAEIYRRQFEPMLEVMANRIADRMISYINKDHNDNKSIKCGDCQDQKQQRVLIVGLLGSQQQEIKNSFEGVYDLRFHDKDSTNSMLKAAATNCDEIILMTKFISHSSHSVVKNAGVKMTMCNGGLTELKKLLEALFMSKP